MPARARKRLGENELQAGDDEDDAEGLQDAAARQALDPERRADEGAEERRGDVDRDLARKPLHRGQVAEESEDRVGKDEADGDTRRVTGRGPAAKDQDGRQEDAAARAGEAREEPDKPAGPDGERR